MRRTTKEMATLVMEQNDAVEERQDKLLLVVENHHASLKKILSALPTIKPELQKELSAEVAAQLAGPVPQMIDTKLEKLRSDLSAEQIEAFADIAGQTEAVRARLEQATRHGLERAERLLLEAPKPEQVKAIVIKALAEQPAPPRQTFLDLFQGEFRSGKSAKAGQIWAFNGGTYLCASDTSVEPERGSQAWQLLAAPGQRGFPGATGATGPAGSGGGGSFSWSSAPASASASGTAGDAAYDGFYFYVCIATNTWARTALGSW